MKQLAALPFEDLGYAKVDRHRALRQGFPEVIFAQGKTAAQVAGIARSLLRDGQPLLVTRLSPEQLPALREVAPRGRYHPEARLFQSGRARAVPGRPGRRAQRGHRGPAGRRGGRCSPRGALGSTAELLTTTSAWRGSIACSPQRRGIERARALVVVAGMEGALPSVVGGLVDRPVIAVPTSVGYGAHFGGLAPLLAMLNTARPA